MDRKELQKLAKLAKIRVNLEEEDKYIEDLNRILNLFEQLQQIPTDDVKRLTHVTSFDESKESTESHAGRVDEIQPSCVNRETALKAAETFGCFFKVPLVIGSESA